MRKCAHTRVILSASNGICLFFCRSKITQYSFYILRGRNACQPRDRLKGFDMPRGTDEKSTNVSWPQWIAGVGVLLLVMQMGFLGGWSSPYIVRLTSPESPFPATLPQITWIVSLISIGRPVGAIGGAMIVNYLGSKSAVLFTCVPVALCWLFTVVANTVEWLYLARLCGGVSVGMLYACYSLYIGEVADPKRRGALIAMGTSGIPVGNLIMSTMGAYLSMNVSAAVSLASCLMLMILFLWLPESPYHLIKKNRYEKARQAIRWYRRDCNVESEFIGLRKFVEDMSRQSLWDTLRDLRTAQFRKSISMIGILITYNQMCGINSILFYMESILTMAKVGIIPAAHVVILVMACGIVGSVLSTFLMDRFGRKILMIVSCAGITVSLCLLTAEFHLLSYGFAATSVEAMSIVGMCGFYMAIFIGILPVPSAILGEIFSPHQKCMAACFTSSVAGVVSFVSTATYLPLLEILSERYLFLLYGLFTATAIPFTIFCVPETKGMSLQEIQDRSMGIDQKCRGSGVDEQAKSREPNSDPFTIS